MLRSNDASKHPDTEFPPDELGIARILVDGTRPIYHYEGEFYKTYAAALGARGGSSKSPAKQAASRQNGKLGGRPQRELHPDED